MGGDPRVDQGLTLGAYLFVLGDGSGYLFCPLQAADAGRVEVRPDVQINDGVFLDALRVTLAKLVWTYTAFLAPTHSREEVSNFSSLWGCPTERSSTTGFGSRTQRFTRTSPLLSVRRLVASIARLVQS